MNQLDLKTLSKMLNLKNVNELTQDINKVSPTSLNTMKLANPIKYYITTLGITCNILKLDYKDLIKTNNMKKEFNLLLDEINLEFKNEELSDDKKILSCEKKIKEFRLKV
jgi:hypothetical protein